QLHSEPELCRFGTWLPFIRDALWRPPPGEHGVILVDEPPESVPFADCRRAQAADGWRVLSDPLPGDGAGAGPAPAPPAPPRPPPPPPRRCPGSPHQRSAASCATAAARPTRARPSPFMLA